MAEKLTQKASTSSPQLLLSSIKKDDIKKTSKISAIFFDLDNTLIPTRLGDAKACRKLAEVLEAQFAFSHEDSTAATQSFLKAFRRCPDNSQTSLDSWRTYLWREALPTRHKHLADQIYLQWLQLRYRYLALAADYVQLLRRFRAAGMRLALITNGPSKAQWEKISKLHVQQYFDCILVSSDMPWEKPNPNIFYAACNFLGVKPVECAMIGDKLETDVKGGRLAHLGVTFWTPLNSMTIDLSDVIHPPDIILKNLLDICKYFPSLNLTASVGANNSNASGSSTSGVATGVGACVQSSRRGSQISCSATTSTCNHHHHHQHHYTHQYQQQRSLQLPCTKYRRSGSLPAMEIECLNSETENSSDSIFN